MRAYTGPGRLVSRALSIANVRAIGALVRERNAWGESVKQDTLGYKVVGMRLDSRLKWAYVDIVSVVD